MMKDKDYKNMDETRMDETEVLNRPEDAGVGGGPKPGGKTPKVVVRPRDKAQRDILAAVAKARETGAVSPELSDGDVAGIVTPVIDALYDAYEEDGTAPTRDAFAERCVSEDVGNVVLTMGSDPFVARRPGRRAVAAICAGCALALAVACGGVALSLSPGGDPSGGEAEGAPGAAVADGGVDTEAVEEAAEEASRAESAAQTGQDGGSVTSTGGAASPSGGSTSSSSGSSSSISSAGSTGGSSSTSSSSSGSGSSSSSSATHTHNWVAQTTTVHHDAVYKTVHHDATYTTVHHDAVTEDRTICNNCGADITGNVDAHMKANILNGCGSYSIKTVVVQAAWDEQVLASAAWDEQVLVSAAWDETVTTGYKCSECGATK